MGSSLHVWDTDAWFYARVGEALREGHWEAAVSMHVPPLFGWLLAIVGPWQGPALVVCQAFFLVMAGLALFRLGRILGHPGVGAAASMLLFTHCVGRYGLQGLPDASFLALHLLLLGDLMMPSPRLWRVLPMMLALAFLRFDTLLYIPLYMGFPIVVARRSWLPVVRCVGVSALIVLSTMTLWTRATHGVWTPTPRFFMLYPSVGEDQLLVSGTTMWREMAAQGRPCPAIVAADLARSHETGIRETENQDPAGLLEVALWQAGAVFDPERMGLLGGFLVFLSCVYSSTSRRMALMAASFTLVYAFLGPRERYLSFSMPLWILVAAAGLPRLGRAGGWILAIWIVLQIREGAWHIRHPESQPLEYRMAGEWIANEDTGLPRKTGAVLSREGSPVYYSRRDWWRLPTGSKEEIVNLVEREGIAYIVADSRYLPAKRPSQTWLLDPSQVPWPCVHTSSFGEEGQTQIVRIYEGPGQR